MYNRKPVEGQYPNGLAYSVHMSVKEDEEECPLHNNYGLVFPKAWVNADNVIVPSFAGNLKVAAVKKRWSRYIFDYGRRLEVGWKCERRKQGIFLELEYNRFSDF